MLAMVVMVAVAVVSILLPRETLRNPHPMACSTSCRENPPSGPMRRSMVVSEG